MAAPAGPAILRARAFAPDRVRWRSTMKNSKLSSLCLAALLHCCAAFGLTACNGPDHGITGLPIPLATPTSAQAKPAEPAVPAQSALKLDPGFPAYKATQGVSGAIKSVGSDTMINLMTLWGEGFKSAYPNVTIEIEGKGSNTAPAALIARTATFGPMSRPMKATEIDEFEKAFGYKPTAIETSIDMLAVYVHKDNPIQSLSLAQIDAIFSATRKGGLEKDIRTWGELGLTGEWADKPISL